MKVILNLDGIVLDKSNRISYVKKNSHNIKQLCSKEEAEAVLTSYNLYLPINSISGDSYLTIGKIIEVAADVDITPFYTRYEDGEFVPNFDKIPVPNILADLMISLEQSLTEIELNQIESEQASTDMDIRLCEIEAMVEVV